MKALTGHINSLDFSKQLDVARNLMDQAQATTTFWGNRVVKVEGFTGSVYLEDLVRKTLGAARQRVNEDNLTPSERVAGIEIVKKLSKFYRVTDQEIKNSNFFTRLLNWIKEFSFIPYTPRFHLEETAAQDFRAYSKAKFLQAFGGSFGELHDHSASDGSFAPPLRILAKEDRIRALLA